MLERIWEGELLRITVLFPETVKLLAALLTGIPQHSKSIIGTVKTLHFPRPPRETESRGIPVHLLLSQEILCLHPERQTRN